MYFHSFFSCPRLDKVGGLGDGPKWTCDIDRVGGQAIRRKQADPDAPHKHCLIYSIGSNGDYQWEDAVQETLSSAGGCEIHIFDPGNFDRGVNNTSKGMMYHKWGLTSSYDVRPTIWLKGEVMTLSRIHFQKSKSYLDMKGELSIS
jgi:hypothetical protein